METKQIKMDVELAQTIVNYLQTKPYQEVHQIIPAIINCKPIEEEKE